MWIRRQEYARSRSDGTSETVPDSKIALIGKPRSVATTFPRNRQVHSLFHYREMCYN